MASINMKCIDFDSEFQKYITKWMLANRGKYRNPDEMEQAAPDEYLRWTNQPADWLGGLTPALYFEQFDDSVMLCKWMFKYINTGVALPDQLTERIVELGDASITPLMELAFDHTLKSDARMAALGALAQIQSDRPLNELVSLISHRKSDDDELSDLAAEMLVNIGPKAMPAVLEGLTSAKPVAGIVFLDIACNFPGDARIYDYAVKILRTCPEYRVLAASYLGKLGDERAIEVLRPLLELAELNYLEYIEIRNAIEALGGEVNGEREFSGDPYYESLRNIDGASASGDDEDEEPLECGCEHDHEHDHEHGHTDAADDD